MHIPIIKGKIHRPQRVVIYGVEGIGKSTLAAYAPAPLFLDTENGSAHLDVDRVLIETLDDLRAACEMLTQTQHDYKTVVLDTADNLHRLCIDAICAENNKKTIEELAYGRGYVMAFDRFRQVLTLFDNLLFAGLNVVIVSHAKIINISLPDSPEFSKYCIKVSAPNKQAEQSRELLKEWCDTLLFCKYDICVNSAEKKAIGENKRVVCTTSAPAWEAKNRLGMPEVMDMTAEVMRRALNLDAVGVAPAPVKAAQAETPAAPADDTAAEDALLLDYFRNGTHVLNSSETLEQLPPRIKTALQTRRADALARAQEWKNKQAELMA